MDASTAAEPAAAAPSAVVLLGIDQEGKPHAARFVMAETERVAKAAELMGMHILTVTNSESIDLVERLPAGRIFEKSSKAFCPFVAKSTYERLAALGGIPLPPLAAKAERGPKPEKAPKPAKGEKAASADKGAKPGAGDAKLAASNLSPSADVEASGVPTDWPIIREGSLVLATTGGVADGWFESVVVEAKPDDLLVLRWRDFSDEALFLRRRDQLALLPAGTPLTAKA